MELNHSFTVPASVEEAWEAFNQIESMAECFPGAVVTSVEGDTFQGTCKVKLGPISLLYSGTGTFLERDEASGRFVVEAKGKDKRGNGTAGAKVTAQITDAGSGSTKVEVKTDLQITGKPAQFGRGVIQDVSDKLLQQFVACLQTKVGQQAAVAPESVPAAPAATTAAPATTPAPLAAAPEATEPAGDIPASAPVRRQVATTPAPAADDALDLGATVIPILVKTYRTQLVGAVIAVVALVLLRKVLRR